ncbi:MAG: ribosome maturation factor RimM [Geminicoccaceae bacterium]
MAQDRPMVCVAQIGAPHGVRGAFRLRCFTEVPESVAAYGPVHDEAGRPLFALRILAEAKGGLIATAPGIEDRDAAEAVRGLRLFVPRERLPATEEDEFYHEDLVGLAARTPEGAPLGRVIGVHNHGAGDILEVELEPGRTELVPFTREAVPVIDLAAGSVEVVLP